VKLLTEEERARKRGRKEKGPLPKATNEKALGGMAATRGNK